MRKIYDDEYQKKYAGGDIEQINFVEDIDEIEKQTKWMTVPLKGATVKNIIGPLFADQLLDQYYIYGNNIDAIMSTVTDGTAMGYEPGSQFMVGIPDKRTGKMVYYLLSVTGFLQLVNMIGSSCPAFFRRNNEKKEEDLNYDLGTVGDKEIQIQIVGDKIQTTHSSSYVILKKNKMLYGITDMLDEKYEDYRFLGGTYSHSMVTAEWAFPKQAEEIRELYLKATEKKAGDMSHLFDTAVPVIRFCTSDVGDSSASIGAYLSSECGLFIKIGTLVKTYHKGKSTEQDVIDACENMFSKFRDMVEAMSKLVDVKIENPIPTMLNVGMSVCGLYRTQLIKAVEEYKETYGEAETATADDVFYVLQQALANMRLLEKTGADKIEDCEEALMRLLSPTFSWSTYDTSVITVNATV